MDSLQLLRGHMSVTREMLGFDSRKNPHSGASHTQQGPGAGPHLPASSYIPGDFSCTAITALTGGQRPESLCRGAI